MTVSPRSGLAGSEGVCVTCQSTSPNRYPIPTPVGGRGGYLGPQSLAKAGYKILKFLPNAWGENWCVIEVSICISLSVGLGGLRTPGRNGDILRAGTSVYVQPCDSSGRAPGVQTAT